MDESDRDDIERSVTSSLLLDDFPGGGGSGGNGGGRSSHHDSYDHHGHSGTTSQQKYPYPSRLYDLEDRSLHASISAHLSGDWSHPKRIAFITQYVSGLLFVCFALAIPFFPRQHLHLPDHPPHDGSGDNGFGRNWFAFLLLFQAIHQFSLGYASSVSLQLQSHDIEYYEHNFWGVLAYLMGGFSHVARICLLWDVMRAHGHSIGGGTIFLLLSSFFLILLYFFYAYRKSLSAKVAAISAALMSVFLSAALFHASSLNHVAPGSAIGAAVGLWLYAILVYPMMCLHTLQKYTFVMEGINILCWTWLVLCYQAFDNCVADS